MSTEVNITNNIPSHQNFTPNSFTLNPLNNKKFKKLTNDIQPVDKSSPLKLSTTISPTTNPNIIMSTKTIDQKSLLITPQILATIPNECDSLNVDDINQLNSTIFENLGFVIDLTINLKRKMELVKIIKKNGGKSCYSCHKATHLITTLQGYTNRTQKVEQALSLKLPILLKEYVHHCAFRKELLDIEPYIINDEKVAQNNTNLNGNKKEDGNLQSSTEIGFDDQKELERFTDFNDTGSFIEQELGGSIEEEDNDILNIIDNNRISPFTASNRSSTPSPSLSISPPPLEQLDDQKKNNTRSPSPLSNITALPNNNNNINSTNTTASSSPVYPSLPNITNLNNQTNNNNNNNIITTAPSTINSDHHIIIIICTIIKNHLLNINQIEHFSLMDGIKRFFNDNFGIVKNIQLLTSDYSIELIFEKESDTIKVLECFKNATTSRSFFLEKFYHQLSLSNSSNSDKEFLLIKKFDYQNLINNGNINNGHPNNISNNEVKQKKFSQKRNHINNIKKSYQNQNGQIFMNNNNNNSKLSNKPNHTNNNLTSSTTQLLSALCTSNGSNHYISNKEQQQYNKYYSNNTYVKNQIEYNDERLFSTTEDDFDYEDSYDEDSYDEDYEEDEEIGYYIDEAEVYHDSSSSNGLKRSSSLKKNSFNDEEEESDYDVDFDNLSSNSSNRVENEIEVSEPTKESNLSVRKRRNTTESSNGFSTFRDNEQYHINNGNVSTRTTRSQSFNSISKPDTKDNSNSNGSFSNPTSPQIPPRSPNSKRRTSPLTINQLLENQQFNLDQDSNSLVTKRKKSKSFLPNLPTLVQILVTFIILSAFFMSLPNGSTDNNINNSMESNNNEQ